MDNISNIQQWKELGLFNDGDYLVYVFKKTEKIVSALYIVSTLIKDNEPMKWEIRENAMSIISIAISLNSDDKTNKNILFQSFFSSSLELLSLLNIACAAGLISVMNTRIISQEIEMLVQFLKQQMTDGAQRAGYILSDKFFSTDAQPSLQGTSNIQPKFSHKGQSTIKDIPKNLDKKGENKKNNIKDKKDSRQGTIIGLLKKDSKLTIKDFAKSIVDCSEKTIQRELISLVQKGLVKREGERRWSTYSLA